MSVDKSRKDTSVKKTITFEEIRKECDISINDVIRILNEFDSANKKENNERQ